MASAGDCSAASPTTPRPTPALQWARRPVQREASGWYSAAGELCMTASDLARWDVAFLEKKILSARDEFTREAKLANGDLTHYALGLQLGEIGGIR